MIIEEITDIQYVGGLRVNEVFTFTRSYEESGLWMRIEGEEGDGGYFNKNCPIG